MARTDTEIANQALYRAGASRAITSLESDGSPEAGAARVLLPQFRDELLELFPWHFARKRVVLAALAGITRTDWGFVYAQPSDMATAYQVVQPGDRYPSAQNLVPYRLEAGENADADVGILLTDLPSAELIYIAKIVNPVRFSALFTGALAFRLAADLAATVTKKADLADLAMRSYIRSLDLAKVHSGNQEVKDQTGAPSWMEDADDTAQRRRWGG